MKLAVSNIAWPAPADSEVLAILKDRAIQAIEVAPTRVWPDWNDISLPAASAFRKHLEAQDFSIPSLQAILFGRPDCKLFGTAQERTALYKHLEFCADLAVTLGAKRLVFGGPKNRDPNGLSPAAAFDSAAETFRLVAPLYNERGVCLCLEANPAQYGCAFVTNSFEAAALVRAVDSPGLQLHLDTACMTLAGEQLSTSIQNQFPWLRHFHASEPNLASLEAPTLEHAAVAKQLTELGYTGWISLEMRATSDPVSSVRQSVEFFAATYQ